MKLMAGTSARDASSRNLLGFDRGVYQPRRLLSASQDCLYTRPPRRATTILEKKRVGYQWVSGGPGLGSNPLKNKKTQGMTLGLLPCSARERLELSSSRRG